MSHRPALLGPFPNPSLKGKGVFNSSWIPLLSQREQGRSQRWQLVPIRQ